MQAVRVAWLDGISPFPRSLPDGLQLVKVEGVKNQSPYEPLDEDINAFLEAAEDGEVDVVVIGNNLGGGQKFAKVVPHFLLPQTIIVSNGEPRTSDRATYGELGIEHLCARYDVLDLIAEVTTDQ